MEPRKPDPSISVENHMQVFARLARIKQGEMHGPPSPRVKRSK